MVLFARTADAPENVARSLQSDIRTLAPDVPVLSAETLELYRLEVKGGRRETTVSSRRRGGRPLHLQVTRLERGLYRIEASETLENGEYALTPAGSNRVFCFEGY